MTSDDLKALRAMLVQHEGLRLKPYTDTAGKITIGVGRNLTDNGITQDEADYLLDHDVAVAIGECTRFPWYGCLDGVRQRVIVDMAFNMGGEKLRTFTEMILAIANGKYAIAANEMLLSAWAKQTKTRAADLAAMMRSGKDTTWQGQG